MSDDKRKVSTDALDTLGTSIGPNEKRDAIHLAVIPVQAKHSLRPGEHVTAEGSTDGSNGPESYVGIVDPFIKRTIRAGEWFWLVIYPRQITSLRHVWSHPGFPEEKVGLGYTSQPTLEYSEGWLRTWVESADQPLSYDQFIKVVSGGRLSVDEGDDYDWSAYKDANCIYIGGRDAYGEIPTEVWQHVENVLGYPVTERPTHFSCSC